MVEMSLLDVKNFITFIQRVKLTGDEAFSFHDITKKTLDAVNNVK